MLCLPVMVWELTDPCPRYIVVTAKRSGWFHERVETSQNYLRRPVLIGADNDRRHTC